MKIRSARRARLGFTRRETTVFFSAMGLCLLAGIYAIAVSTMTESEDQRKGKLTGPETIDEKARETKFSFLLTNGDDDPIKDAPVTISLDTTRTQITTLGQVAGKILSINGRHVGGATAEARTSFDGTLEIRIALELPAGSSGSLTAKFKELTREKTVTAPFEIK